MCFSVVCLFTVFAITVSMASLKDTSEDMFRQCLISRPSASFGYCLGVGAISKLQNWDNDPKFDIVDGISFSRDEQQYREDYNFIDRDPSDLSSIIDSASHVFSSRNMAWDMEFVYPGLSMQITPSVSPGGVLEFALDPHREALSQQTLKEASTGRLLTRSFFVPFLLGLKFKLITLIPIIFALLALLAKKALVISKLALIASSAWGMGALLFNNNNNHHYQNNHGHHGHYHPINPAFGGHHHYQSFRQPDVDYTDIKYRVNNNEYEDQLRIYGDLKLKELQGRNDLNKERDDTSKGRNFAWEDKKNKNKT